MSTLFFCGKVTRQPERGLMDGSMDKLYKDAQRDKQQAYGDDNEGGRERGSARTVETWCLWLIGNRFDLFQVAQVVEEIPHRLVTLLLVTTNSSHHYSSQCWRELRIHEEDRGWVLRDMLVHNRKDILSLKRRMAAEHFIQHHTDGINIRANHTTLAPELFRGHIIRRAYCLGETSPGHAPRTFE